MHRRELAAMCDHTLLKADARDEQIVRLCEEAKRYHFASVCVNPCQVERAAALLRGTGVAVCTVVGFPLGASTAAAKAFEARDACARGASEIDMVINVGALRSGREEEVYEEICAVVAASRPALTKVILETCYLSDDEKRTACRLARRAGADFVKTSTGFGPGGATARDVALMRAAVGESMRVKAAGGIRTYADAMAMVEAGADRLGVSASVAILEGAPD